MEPKANIEMLSLSTFLCKEKIINKKEKKWQKKCPLSTVIIIDIFLLSYFL